MKFTSTVQQFEDESTMIEIFLQLSLRGVN